MLQVPDLLRQVTRGNGSVWIQIRIFEIEYLHVRIWIYPQVNSWCALFHIDWASDWTTGKSWLNLMFAGCSLEKENDSLFFKAYLIEYFKCFFFFWSDKCTLHPIRQMGYFSAPGRAQMQSRGSIVSSMVGLILRYWDRSYICRFWQRSHINHHRFSGYSMMYVVESPTHLQ